MSFRYHDTARKLDEALAEDFKIAEPEVAQPVVSDGLQRIAAGVLATDQLRNTKLAAAAAVEQDLKENEIRKRLSALVKEKHASLDDYVEVAATLK